LAEKVKSLLEQHEAAEKAGEASGTVERLSAPDKVHAPIKRLERQAGRLAAFWAVNTPKRGKRGKELQRKIPDNESAKMQTGHGVIQGSKGQAWGDAQYQVIMHAEAFGHGQDDGHGAAMGEGAQANLKAIGLAEHYFAGKILSADSNYHREANLKECAHEQLDA
jgi:hypothetical protein